MLGHIPAGQSRPPVHMLASESDMIASLALRVEHRQPAVAAMLLEEIDRAEIHDVDTLPESAITIGSEVDFVDEKTCQLRKVELVLPAQANIAFGRISILTPMGAALYGLVAGESIDWPDRHGEKRRIKILRVRQPAPND